MIGRYIYYEQIFVIFLMTVVITFIIKIHSIYFVIIFHKYTYSSDLQIYFIELIYRIFYLNNQSCYCIQ